MIAARFLTATAALFVVLAVVSTQGASARLLLAAFGVGWAGAALVARRWLPSASRGQIEALAWAGIVTVSALVYVADTYTSVASLAYGCLVTTGFALWPPRRAVLHLIGIAVAYAVVLAIVTPACRGAALGVGRGAARVPGADRQLDRRPGCASW